jgi:hypothetical protein
VLVLGIGGGSGGRGTREGGVRMRMGGWVMYRRDL